MHIIAAVSELHAQQKLKIYFKAWHDFTVTDTDFDTARFFIFRHETTW